MEDTYSKAFTELSVIIDNMEIDIKDKIPEMTIEAINKGKSNEYNFIYNPQKKLKEQNILPETKSLLSIIYSDYLCSDEEKKKWQEYDKFVGNKIKDEKMKKYSNNDVFSDKFIQNEKLVDDSLIKYEKNGWFENLIKNIKEKIKKIF